ncbi:hypothetical protein TWF694_000818 [Orbilia ellipsospora]|uniref:Uncharacterized protein n=1 Tax=Orbilia ellipsospora TaxID=2528407 RepID=A0AAV9XQ33_9PEZI
MKRNDTPAYHDVDGTMAPSVPYLASLKIMPTHGYSASTEVIKFTLVRLHAFWDSSRTVDITYKKHGKSAISRL